jgi:hypothetical protein
MQKNKQNEPGGPRANRKKRKITQALKPLLTLSKELELKATLLLSTVKSLTQETKKRPCQSFV